MASDTACGDPLSGVPLLSAQKLTPGERWIFSAGFNVDAELTSTGRIDCELADLQRLATSGARVAILSHQGTYRDNSATALNHVADYLSRRLGQQVRYIPENASDAAVRAAEELVPGEIVLFGNTRHHAGEERGDPDLARRFALLGNRVAVGGFSKAHRSHASNTEVLRYLAGYAAGSLVNEVRFLAPWARWDSEESTAAVLGGQKPEKILVGLAHAMRTCDLVVPGGVVLNTVLRAQGYEIGDSDLGSRPDACLNSVQQMMGASMKASLHVPRTVWAAPMHSGKIMDKAQPVSVDDGVPAGHGIVDFEIEQWAVELLAAADRAVLAGTPSRYLDGQTRSSETLLAALSPISPRSLLLGGDTVAELPWSGPVSTGGGSALQLLATGACAVLDALRSNAGNSNADVCSGSVDDPRDGEHK